MTLGRLSAVLSAVVFLITALAILVALSLASAKEKEKVCKQADGTERECPECADVCLKEGCACPVNHFIKTGVFVCQRRDGYNDCVPHFAPSGS